MDLGLKDKNVVVTGGSKGIGYAAAKIFLQEGAKVTICARHKEELGRAVLELGKLGKIQGCVLDGSTEAGMEKHFLSCKLYLMFRNWNNLYEI